MWVCPKCNAYNDAENANCVECRASRFNKKYKRAAKLEAGLIRCSYADSRSTAKPSRRLKTESDERRSATKAPPIPSYCGSCGCHIMEEARFCPECGAKL